MFMASNSTLVLPARSYLQTLWVFFSWVGKGDIAKQRQTDVDRGRRFHGDRMYAAQCVSRGRLGILFRLQR